MMDNSPPSVRLSWSNAIYFALAVAIVNGFGRFAYALLLPVMREDLQWDYAFSGWLNTANSLGYGAGALLGMLLLTRIKPASLFIWGLVFTVITLLLFSFSSHLITMLVLRLFCGVGSAWVFACGGALIAMNYSAEPAKSASAIAIYYAGGGLGIAMSGILLYPVLELGLSWPLGWLILGFAGLILALKPSQLALSIGGTYGEYSHERLPWRQYQVVSWAYLLYGIGYIVYLTFVIAWLREMQIATTLALGVWLVMGFAAMCSGYIWRNAMARWSPSHVFALASIGTGLGTAMPIISQTYWMLIFSAALVGGSFFMVPGAMMALARKTLKQNLWAKAMNFFTMLFAIGQAIGPVAAGYIADHYGMNTAMAFGAITLWIAAALALRQKVTTLKQ